MQTAAKVVNGRKYQTLVGIFAIHKKMKKAIRPAIKAVPANKATCLASFSVRIGKTRTLHAARDRDETPARSTSSATRKVGAIASKDSSRSMAGRKPICDSTDQSCASRMIARYTAAASLAAGIPNGHCGQGIFEIVAPYPDCSGSGTNREEKNEF